MNWWNNEKICITVDCLVIFASAIAGMVGCIVSKAWLACGGLFVLGVATMALALSIRHN